MGAHEQKTPRSRAFWLRRIFGGAAKAPSISLSSYLSITTWIVALPLMIATFILVWLVSNDDRHAKREFLVSSAHVLSDVVGRQIDKYFVLSNAFAHSELLQKGDLAGFETQAASLLSGMPEATLIVAAPDGRILASAPRLPEDSLLLGERAGLVREAFALGATFLSDVSSKTPHQAHASVETPIFRDGKPLYEMGLILSLDQFASLLQHQKYPAGWLTGVVDRKGMFVARNPEGAGAPGTPAGAGFRDAVSHVSDAVATHDTIEGERVVSAYAAIPYGWTVGVEANYALIERNTPLLTLSLAGAALTASLILSYLNGRRLAGRVRAIQARSEQLVAGAPIVLAPSGVRELDALSASLVEASTILQRRSEQQKRAEDDLRKSEEHFRVLTDSLPQLVWTAGPDGRIEYTNAQRDLYGEDGVSQTDWESIIHPEDRRATAETWLRASETGQPYQKEHRLMVTGKGYLWHISRAAPLLDAQGAVVRWYGTTTDIDEHKMREKNIRLLMSEVNHRSRNLLAVAQAIARRSVTSGETARNFERKFSERLLGLVASQELLTRHDWRGVPLDALVRAQTFDSLDNHAPRISAEGPSIVLNPSAAQTLGLALHELWSNAVRYGALSNDAGCVNVRWKLDETNGEPRFEMEWREHGGPPPPRKPSLGFGSIVIERMVAAGLPGDASLTFEDEGVHWRVSAPYKQVIVTH